MVGPVLSAAERPGDPRGWLGWGKTELSPEATFPSCCPSSGPRGWSLEPGRLLEGDVVEALLRQKGDLPKDNWQALHCCLRGSPSPLPEAGRGEVPAGRSLWGRRQLWAQRDSHQLPSDTSGPHFG